MDVNESRAIATVMIWIMMGITLGVAAVAASSGVVMTLAIVMGLLAFASTGFIWQSGGGGEKGKPKRESSSDARVQLLLQLMDDEDRERLKKRLMNELEGDGEVYDLESLLNAKNGR